MDKSKGLRSVFTLLNSAPTRSYAGCSDKHLPIAVHAIFRHGNRTPDLHTYENDPYKDETYPPYGRGQLTNEGKRTAHGLGRFLRERYGHLLDNGYDPKRIYSRSTDMDRTKMTLQYVLAGLCSPEKDFDEKRHLDDDFQSIVIDSCPLMEDRLLFPVYDPKWYETYKTYVSELAEQGYFRQYEDLFEYLSKHTGTKITETFGAFVIYFTLITQEENGMKLPEWTKEIYPDRLQEIARRQYALMAGTPTLKKIMSGDLLSKILEDTRNVITNGDSRKLFLYSGHESNIAATLVTLGIDPPEVPPYGSCLLFEVYKSEKSADFGFAIFYRGGERSEPYRLSLPGIEENDFFQQYPEVVDILRSYQPEESHK